MPHSSIRLVPVLAALALPPAATAQSVPYGLDQRPQPRGGNLDSLLPTRVGAFERPSLSPDAMLKSDEDICKTATFVSWSRGPYFFYVHASSAGALDGFMRAFPY